MPNSIRTRGAKEEKVTGEEEEEREGERRGGRRLQPPMSYGCELDLPLVEPECCWSHPYASEGAFNSQKNLRSIRHIEFSDTYIEH